MIGFRSFHGDQKQSIPNLNYNKNSHNLPLLRPMLHRRSLKKQMTMKPFLKSFDNVKFEIRFPKLGKPVSMVIFFFVGVGVSQKMTFTACSHEEEITK